MSMRKGVFRELGHWAAAKVRGGDGRDDGRDDGPATEGGPSADTRIQRGASIGRYVVQGWIAEGGMAEVYAAYDPNLDRKLAIKLVRVEGGNGVGIVDGKARLLREAKAIAKLSHPNVVIIHDVGSYEDRVFIAMEHIEGGTLTYWRHAQPRTWREVLAVFMAAGRGLQHAHEANLVHRDFKPDNVMVRVDGEVRVMDFGLVRHVDALEVTPMREYVPSSPEPGRADLSLDATVGLIRPAGERSSSGGPPAQRSKLTATGTTMGTPAYMAPEQFGGQVVDARSDQFSFCVALYEALYGERPFSGATMVALARSVRVGQVKPPPKRSEVPVIVWQALRRGLSVIPADRYPSMKDLLADLARHPQPPRRRIPTAETLTATADLASLLETLLQKPVSAKVQPAKVSHDTGVVAVYVGDDGAPGALVHFDLLAAGSTAAALMSFPAVMVEEAISDGKLPPILMDNLREVANVLAKVVRGMSPAHLRIQDVYRIPDAVPPGIAAALKTASSSISFETVVAGYPAGHIAVMGIGPKTPGISHEEQAILRRALIVDDSAAMRLVVGRVLTRLGVAEILQAANGQAGLTCLDGGAAIDAVFVDWGMPVMDGMTFIKSVRADRRFDRVRLLMVTTEDDQAKVEAALAAGADEYLVKPITEESLRRKLEGLGLKTT